MSENDTPIESAKSDGAGSKWINDPEVMDIYQQVVNRCEEIKEMLEDKRQKTVDALNDYTSDIVDQFRTQLIPKFAASFERDESSSSAYNSDEEHHDDHESKHESYDSGIVSDSTNKPYDDSTAQCQTDAFQTSADPATGQSNLAIESGTTQPNSVSAPHYNMVLQNVDKVANLLHGFYSVD